MAPIPPFPHHRPIADDDRAAIETRSRGTPHSSDFGFTSLRCWDIKERYRISLLNDNLVVRFTDYVTEAPFFSLLGDRAIVDSVLTLLNHCRDKGLPPRLKLVPESVVQAEPCLADVVTLDEDPDNVDYVYTTEAWACLPGGTFREHRRKIRRLLESAPLTCRRLDLTSPATGQAVISLWHRWDAQKPVESTDATVENREIELAAIERLFRLADLDRLAGLGIHYGADLVAFSISEVLSGGAEAVIHFQKTDRAYRGLASFLCHQDGRRLHAQGVDLINFEQDLGLRGLREFKRSLGPRRLLPKFVITP